MADDRINNVEPWSPGGRRQWSEAEEAGNARRLNAEAEISEEKLFWMKVRRWGQGALGLLAVEGVIAVIVLGILYL